MNKSPSSLSIVIPCHNEQEVIASTYRELKRLVDAFLVKGMISGYEIVLVNNGSTDNTLLEMQSICELDANVIAVDLRRNYGYQGSITAGLFHATKDMVVSIDADLQDDHEKIGQMIEFYQQGYEMVLGVREDRSADHFFKRNTARLYYRLLGVMGVKSEPNHGDFRLLSRQLVETLKTMPERNRYLRGLIFELESRYAIVSYARRKREAGRSKFNLLALFSLALDGITSFSATPIRLVSMLGFFMAFASLVGLIVVVAMKVFFGIPVPGWASIVFSLFFFAGLQNLSIGIIGEYIAKIYIETKGRPPFLVRRIYRKNEPRC